MFTRKVKLRGSYLSGHRRPWMAGSIFPPKLGLDHCPQKEVRAGVELSRRKWFETLLPTSLYKPHKNEDYTFLSARFSLGRSNRSLN